MMNHADFQSILAIVGAIPSTKNKCLQKWDFRTRINEKNLQQKRFEKKHPKISSQWKIIKKDLKLMVFQPLAFLRIYTLED